MDSCLSYHKVSICKCHQQQLYPDQGKLNEVAFNHVSHDVHILIAIY